MSGFMSWQCLLQCSSGALHDPYLFVIPTPAPAPTPVPNSRECGCQAVRHLKAKASKFSRNSGGGRLSNLRRNITATFRSHLLHFYRQIHSCPRSFAPCVTYWKHVRYTCTYTWTELSGVSR